MCIADAFKDNALQSQAESQKKQMGRERVALAAVVGDLPLLDINREMLMSKKDKSMIRCAHLNPTFESGTI